MIKKTGNKLLLAIAAACALVQGACDTERDPCLEPVTVALTMHTYRSADTGTSTLDTLFANALFAPLDSNKIVYQAKAIPVYRVTLSPVADSCRWYLQPDSAQVGKRDTLVFFYRRNLQFLSNACGYTYYYTVDSIRSTIRAFADTVHALDSVRLANGSINGKADVTHVKLYIHKRQ
jgi:hypothetical protein